MADHTPLAGIAKDATLLELAKETSLLDLITAVVKESTMAAFAAIAAKDQTVAEVRAETANLSEMLEEVAARIADAADSMGNMTTDAAGRVRVATESQGNITTVSNITQLNGIGSYQANQFMFLQSQMAEDNLRRNVVIS